MTSAQPHFDGALAYSFERLAQELPYELTYHNLAHTRDDVLPATQRLAALSGLRGGDVRLLEVGAAFHDIGWVVQGQDHEFIGAEIAGRTLPGFGFAAEQITTIQGLILATRPAQRPHTFLEALLADADLDQLGREDAPARGAALRAERVHLGQAFTDAEWLATQIAYYRRHSYHTAAARALRGEGKERNLQTLLAQMAALKA